MRYTTFRRGSRFALALLAFLLTVLIVMAVWVGIAYLRGGVQGVLRISWVSRLVGIDRQTDLGMEPISREERNTLEDRLGMEVARLRPDNGRVVQQEELLLSEGQFAYLLDHAGTDPDVLNEVQVRIEEGEGEKDNHVTLSAIASPAAAATLVGFTPDALYAAVGELPASVAVLARIALPDPANPEETALLEEIQIGQIALPATLVDSANKELAMGLETFFLNQFGIRLETLGSDGIGIQIEGAIPVGEPIKTS
mgnify:CR=1 FL=1